MGASDAGAAPANKKEIVATQKVWSLKLEGSAYAPGQETAFIGKFMQALKQDALFSELFDDIQLSNINQRKISNYDVYDFVLVCHFKKDKI